ncbi:MAG: hypothetical protein ACJ8FY_20115 [Gemmataceae bacterium]
MRRSRKGLGLMALGLLGLAGCRTSDANLKPPPNKEVYLLPPTDDPRYSNYPNFPKGTLNQEYVKRDKEREENGPGSSPKGMPHFGGSGGNGGGLGNGY